jgi:hypothetical protein
MHAPANARQAARDIGDEHFDLGRLTRGERMAVIVAAEPPRPKRRPPGMTEPGASPP